MPEYMTMQQVADALGMSVSGIYKRMNEDEDFVTFKVGKRRFMRREALERYIAQSEHRELEARGLA